VFQVAVSVFLLAGTGLALQMMAPWDAASGSSRATADG
jgi:hypothetical protein